MISLISHFLSQRLRKTQPPTSLSYALQVNQGCVSPTLVFKAKNIAADAVADFSNIQLVLNGFFNKTEKQNGRQLLALEAGAYCILSLFVYIGKFLHSKTTKKIKQNRKNESYFWEAKRFK